MARLLITALVLAGTLLGAQAAPDDDAAPLRRLEVQLDGRTLREPLDLYQTDYQVLLPLAAVSRLPGLDTRVQAAHGRAAGTLPGSGEPFCLDLHDATMRVGERRVSFEPRLAQVIGDDIYVSTQLLSRWLKLELAVDLPHWQLRLRTPSTPDQAAVAAAPPPPLSATRRLDDSNLLVLEVQLDGMVLSDSLAAYQDGGQTLLPLGELARLLTLAIQVQPERGSANGTLRGDKAFGLNLADAQVTLAGREQGFEPRLAGVVGDDIDVSRRLLGRWLPVDLQLDLAALQLKVVPLEKLPLQARLERERLAAALAGASAADTRPNYPYQQSTPGLIGVPSIDQSFGADARFGRDSRQFKAAYTAYLTSDLLGMEGSAYVLKTRDKARPDLRLTLARHDPEAELLGPLHARAVALGHLALPSVRNVMQGSVSGNGVSVSNRPLDQPNSFDRHSLRGELPLSFGNNEFRLVFHGPLGQLRVEKQSFMLDRASLKPGELQYTLASQLAEDGTVRSLAQAELGLGQRLTGQFGWVRRPGPVNGSPQDYGQLGLLAYLDQAILSSRLVGMRGGRWNLDGQPLAGSGAVSARAFVDRNMNGIRDADEELVPNAGFILNGGGRHPRLTGPEGTALLNRLAPGRYADIALDPTTLEDPQWRPLTPGTRVLPRPGRVEMLEFPVIVTSEVEGTVWLAEANGKKRGIGAAQLELVDHDGQVVATTSSADGYYLFHQVAPGLRRLRIAPDQAAKLKLQGALARDVDVPGNGDFLSGQDLELRLQ
ncbi:MAG: hypothetical protein ACK44A_14480 [Roseateles sp.]